MTDRAAKQRAARAHQKRAVDEARRNPWRMTTVWLDSKGPVQATWRAISPPPAEA